MHPAQIKAALAIAGYKQRALGDEMGLTEATISAVVNGRSRSKHVEERIAEITGLPLARLWPQWYGEKQPVLTGADYELVRAFRAAPAAVQAEVLRRLAGAGSGHHVRADRGSVAAGRDVTIGGAEKKKPRR